ncbi:MAG TPA: hypothetical protein VJ739_00630, partial [Gemmataceae bacterium]|nr:hypothetical protein [Gemmataceae bacterium]
MSSETVTTLRGRGAAGVLPSQDDASGGHPLPSPRPSVRNAGAVLGAEIDFFNVAPHQVAVEIKVTNDS